MYDYLVNSKNDYLTEIYNILLNQSYQTLLYNPHLIEFYENSIFTKSRIWGQQFGEEWQTSIKIVVKSLSVNGNQWKWVVIVVAG